MASKPKDKPKDPEGEPEEEDEVERTGSWRAQEREGDPRYCPWCPAPKLRGAGSLKEGAPLPPGAWDFLAHKAIQNRAHIMGHNQLMGRAIQDAVSKLGGINPLFLNRATRSWAPRGGRLSFVEISPRL